MELFTVLKAIFFLRLFVFSLPLFSSCESPTHKRVADSSPFPHGFLWGTASSAYQNSNSPENSFPNKNIADEVTILRLQYEGAYKAGGKGLNNWDGFTHQHPDKINDGSNGDIAVDQFHRYLDDIDLMNSLGVDSYRFSISWARILPNGKFGHVNYAGIRHYNKLIDALLSKGIQPFVTLTHMDYPQVLEDSYKSWLSPQIQSDFGYFAEVCFKHFGDRVKYWVTINEPNQQIVLSYLQGIFPPTRCSTPFGNCSSGNSEKEPFVAAHNMILAHAAAADIYRTKYQSRQKGKIGIVVQTMWFEPVSNSTADRLAAERAHSFYSNWILDPIVFGRYPAEMENILGPSLPRFSCNDATKLSNGLDFIGINHYTSYYVQDCIFSACAPGDGGSATEGFARKLSVYNGVPIGELTDIFWQHVDPDGFRKILNYMKRRYNNTPMFITENGFGEMQKSNSTREELIHDVKRVDYLKGYLDAMKTAMREGADVKGYFTWSLMDNFEWLYGYTLRFGLYFVDYADSLKRTPKLSASWYKNFIAEHKRCRNMCRHTL